MKLIAELLSIGEQTSVNLANVYKSLKGDWGTAGHVSEDAITGWNIAYQDPNRVDAVVNVTLKDGKVKAVIMNDAEERVVHIATRGDTLVAADLNKEFFKFQDDHPSEY